MFTISDFERVRNETKPKSILDSVLFSVQKSELAYAMNLCNSHDRGCYAEKLLRNKLLDHGFDVYHCVYGSEYDLLLDDCIRAEVKLATIQQSGKQTQYVFHKIKPEFFDILFLVFLNPHGATIKWATTESVSDWSTNYIRGKQGYQIRFNGGMESSNLVYNETFDSFVNSFRKKTLDSRYSIA
jgi:hypothetical protein